MRLIVILVWFLVFGVGLGEHCRVAESTLFCIGKWDGVIRRGISQLVVREWDGRWCGTGEGPEKIIIFARQWTCEKFRAQCGLTPYSVNGEDCQKATEANVVKVRVSVEVTTGEDRSAYEQSSLVVTTTTWTEEWGVVTGSATITERPVTWAYVWISGLGGLCLLLVCVIVCVCRKKKLFFQCKPRTSPPPSRRENVLFNLPRSCQEDNNSDISLQVYP